MRFSTMKLAAMAAVALLAGGCGGGDDRDYETPAKRVTFSGAIHTGGTAAASGVGANRAVAVVCRSGTGASLSNAQGEYMVAIDDAVGPCLLTVAVGAVTTAPATPAGQMRSIVAGDGGRANITPLTELLVDYLQVQIGAGSGGAGTGAGVAPTAIAANPKLETLLGNPAALAASVNRVIALVKSAGNVADVAIPADFLVAPVNPQDPALDTLRARGVIGPTGLVAPAVVDAVLREAAGNKL